MSVNVTLPAVGTGSATPVVEASSNADGSVRQVVSVAGLTVALQSAITVSTTAYSAGDCIGAFSTFAGAARNQNGLTSGRVKNIVMTAKSLQAGEVDCYLFSSTLSTASVFTDNSAPAIASSDIPKLIGRFPLVDIDTGLSTSFTMWQAANLDFAFNLAGITSIYASLVTKGTPTFLTTGDVTLTIGINND